MSAAEDLTPEQLAKRTAWGLEKLLRKGEKKARRAREVPVACAACNRPPRFFSWSPAPTPAGAIRGTSLPKGMRWTDDGKVEELVSLSSPMVAVKMGEERRLIHRACLRRKQP